MTFKAEALPVIPEDEFVPARWLGEDAEPHLDVYPRWRGYSTNPEDGKETRFYPLRVDNFGQVLPHIYQTMLQESSEEAKMLDRAHAVINNRYDGRGGFGYDSAVEHFQALLKYDLKGEEAREAGIPQKVAQALELYQNIREQRERKVAEGLSAVISNFELYVFAFDMRGGTKGYMAPLAGIVNSRKGQRMRYEPVVTDHEGNVGILPSNISVGAGISARAA